ncbi:MAG: carboxypeptidase regulatory-like domain-containing protein [Ignavibacteriales bacterium]|nr:carboxypeptidase regulatory-like domain-containing protein [Ignavibacteriales bacterium]
MKKNAIKNFVQIFLVLITLTSVTFGQDAGKIKGKVIENETDAPLEYATVTIISSSGIIMGGTKTDYDGFFNFTDPVGHIHYQD